MINLENLLAHKLDAAFGACPPLVQAGCQRPPLPCQRALSGTLNMRKGMNQFADHWRTE
jgi:hypothetical protein